MNRLLIPILLSAILFVLPSAGVAQNLGSMEWSTVGLQMTRAELEDLLGRLDALGDDASVEAAVRQRAQRDADLVRDRLRDGDFSVGDRVILEVRGEEEISDTLVVRSGQRIVVPVLGELSVAGVLRSELEEYLTDELGQFLVNPVVRAHSLIRISLVGEVNSPGFYAVPPDLILDDLLMLAGGPTRTAGLRKLRVERGSERIWEGENLEAAVIEGRTLDQLNLKAGDRVVVPEETRRDWWRIASFIVGPAVTILVIATR
ncbi:MAG: polysaccharide biosynthesis/export family protein [Gemmatimonadota bacterium]